MTLVHAAKDGADGGLVDVAQVEDHHAIVTVQLDLAGVLHVARRQLSTAEVLEEAAAVLVLFVLVDAEDTDALDQV